MLNGSMGGLQGTENQSLRKPKKLDYTVGCYFSIVVPVSYVSWHNIICCPFSSDDAGNSYLTFLYFDMGSPVFSMSFLLYCVEKIPRAQNQDPQQPAYRIALTGK